MKPHQRDPPYQETGQQRETTRTQDSLFGHCPNLLAHPRRLSWRSLTMVMRAHIVPTCRQIHITTGRLTLLPNPHQMSAVHHPTALVALALLDQDHWHRSPPTSMDPSFLLRILAAWNAQAQAISEIFPNSRRPQMGKTSPCPLRRLRLQVSLGDGN